MAESSEALAARARALYASGEHAAAAELYGEAIDAVPCLDAASASLVATLYANRSAARLQSDESSTAGAHDAALSLALAPSAWKPRLRLAKALAAAERESEASQQASIVLGLPNLPANAAQEASALLRLSAARAAAAQSASISGVTEAHRGMVQRTQMLRVHLCPLTAAVCSGRWHTLSVRLSNEMVSSIGVDECCP